MADPQTRAEPVSDIAPKAQPGVGTLVSRIGDDLKTMAEDHVALARLELIEGLKEPLADAVAVLLGGMLAVFGLGLLSVAAVVALEPLIEPLWLRMVLMAIVYFVAGGALVRGYIKQLGKDTPPKLDRTKREAARTAAVIKDELREGITRDD
jgi:uncharacterized membrane protein YqjE